MDVSGALELNAAPTGSCIWSPMLLKLETTVGPRPALTLLLVTSSEDWLGLEPAAPPLDN